MSKIKNFFFGKGGGTAYAIISAIFTFVPEDFFKHGIILCNWQDSSVLLVNRLITFLVVLILTNICYCLYCRFRRRVTISDNNYSITIEYGDLFSKKDGLKVVHFDECFTTSVGSRPEDIKPDSVCGQYLQKYPIANMRELIAEAGLKSIGKSLCGQKDKYTQGSIIPREDFLLMAFAKLDRTGRGIFTYEKYVECLDKLWEQIDLYHGTKDVYLPILGSQITRFDKELSQQELLDIMIASYRLSDRKLRYPYRLHIVCKKRDGFSLNSIFGVEK
ncbi:macro domain-containing protein [Segatella bryantii]|jgi:hypothetical protein|uniref:Thoeris protein ThsA Macro domain-containing protein n=1 Tax=Segatella bryantii TaxID=77095 RepID=A0ABX4EKG9_SEGBR|nr:macro domain-containing protein [Segatella bryantii]OYP57171.1 hypothetical protein CIK91_01050 [Segatella bryantii]UKK82280.1 DUF6430 domain-containing protein [Segatella bryantii]